MEKFKKLYQELTELFIEREDIITGLIVGLLAEKNLLMVGEPGTAKSMMINELSRRLEGTRCFSYLMTGFTRPEEIIGPVSLKGLEEDNFKRVLKGKIADSQFVFLDEIFNANSACANTILTILNEKKFYNGCEVIDVPLIMLVGASNSLPLKNNELSAFYDRFLLRYEVNYIKDRSNLEKMLKTPKDATGTVFITPEELAQVRKLVKKVVISPLIIRKLINIVFKLRSKGIDISDRRVKESVDILKSHAFFNGRMEVGEDDLKFLRNVFWNFPEEKKIFDEQLLPFTMPVEVKITEILKEARRLKENISVIKEKGRRLALGNEVNLRLTELQEELGQLRDLSYEEDIEWSGFNDAGKELEEIQSEVLRECLGFNQDSGR